MNEKYELKQLLTYNTQLLKYNPMGYSVEGICNVYLERHLIGVNIKKMPISRVATQLWG
jgi:hypothetical protein